MSKQTETKSGQGFVFTEAQVEAARRESNRHIFAGHGKCRCGAAGLTSIGHGRHAMRAALVAASNTAPQAPYSDPVMTAPQTESDERAKLIAKLQATPPAEIKTDTYGVYVLMHQAAAALANSATPIRPNEGEIADVIEASSNAWHVARESGLNVVPLADYLASAVVEAIGGEGR